MATVGISGARIRFGAHHALGRVRLSRRASLRGAVAGLAAIGVATQEMGRARAQGATPEAAAATPEPAFAGLIDIGDRSLYLECQGSGGPTVVFVSGYRDSSVVWTTDLQQRSPSPTMVFPGVATFTRVCAYDRPGTAASIGDEDLIGRSDAIAQPRHAAELVAELHALVHAAGIETPVVLVGHSLGGFLARLYASTYPEDVFGLVVVDAYSELLEELTTPQKWLALVELNRAQGTDTMVPIPGYGDLETIGFGSDNAVMREALALHPLAPMPLASLGHGIPLDVPHPPEGFTAESWKHSFRKQMWG